MAADPTVSEVHAAAAAGHMEQAQQMIAQVLRDHPNSAKAHYVEAELLAHQGRNAEARLDLDTAQRLDPSMKFVSGTSLAELKQQLAGSGSVAQARPVEPRQRSHFPIGWIFVGLAALVLFALFRRRQQQASYAGSQGGSYGTPYGGGGYPSAGGPWNAPATGRSGILGGLATGAAMGAGFAAGETLIDRLVDGDRGPREEFYRPEAGAGSFDTNQDMGGDNFGINDAGSSPYLNARQAAFFLKMSARSLQRLRASGKGPTVRRHARMVLYHIDDLEAWSRSRVDARAREAQL